MGSTVYVNKVQAEGLRLTNTTGVALVVNEYTVMGGKGLKAKEAIAIGAIGAFEDCFKEEVQAADFTGGEAVFATANLPIYWNPTTKVFSNTSAAGKYRVGYTIAPIAGGVVSFNAVEPVLI